MPASDVAAVKDGKLKTPVGDAPLIPLLLIMTGGYLAWFGVHYWRDQKTIWPTDVPKSVLQGKGVPVPVPAPSTAQADIASASAGGNTPGGPGSASGDQIASIAEADIGHCYVFGGAPGTDGKHCWDCSSACNWWIGKKAGLAIPGDKHYDGSSHGPDVASWIAWNGVERHALGNIKPGDILAWGPNQHMGIAVSSSEMVSAENPQLGTRKSTFQGFGVTPPIVLRLRATLGPKPGPQSKDALKNQATGKLLAARYGWSPSQSQSEWDSLVALWDGESGWSTTAANPSGAYGIPQALPGSKMAQFGRKWKTSAVIQIRWGLWYIEQRYGSPSAAWAHEQQFGWY